MSKLTAIHKQIAALQAKAERITKQEMSAAVAKVKSLMDDFGVTIEHLTHSVVGKTSARKSTAGKTAKASKKTASVAKYADPKSGKTWSGFGRAPGWIAGAKNRDAFLVDTTGIKAAEHAVKAPAAAKKAAGKVAKAAKVAKKTANPAGKRMKAEATAAAAKAAGKAAATKSATAKKAAAKTVANPKVAAKKVSGRKAPVTDSAPAPVESPATAA